MKLRKFLPARSELEEFLPMCEDFYSDACWQVPRSFSGEKIVADKADEAAGLTPSNDEAGLRSLHRYERYYRYSAGSEAPPKPGSTASWNALLVQ